MQKKKKKYLISRWAKQPIFSSSPGVVVQRDIISIILSASHNVCVSS